MVWDSSDRLFITVLSDRPSFEQHRVVDIDELSEEINVNI